MGSLFHSGIRVQCTSCSKFEFDFNSAMFVSYDVVCLLGPSIRGLGFIP